MILSGGCHCGAVCFDCAPPEPLEVLDCNCSICERTGYLHLIVPHAQFELLAGRNNLTSYRFGSGQAEHLFCTTCGIKSFYQPRSHPDSWSVNARCLDEFASLTLTVTKFDGRNWERSIKDL